MTVFRRSAIVVSAIVALTTLLLAGIWLYQRHAHRNAFYQRIDSLMQEASKLSAMTSQGVSFNEFRSQLASVHAKYDLIKDRWDDGKWPAGYGSFGLAVVDWDQALIFWKKDLSIPASFNHISSDLEVVSFYQSNDPKLRALVAESGQPAVNLTLAVRVFMGDASDLFDQSKNSIERVR